MDVTVSGISMFSSFSHLWNAAAAIVSSWFGSVMFVKFLQSSKAEYPIVRTASGIVIVASAVPAMPEV